MEKSSENIIYLLQTYTQYTYTHGWAHATGFLLKKRKRRKKNVPFDFHVCCVASSPLPMSFGIFSLPCFLSLSFSSASYSINFNLKVSSSLF